MIHKTGEILAGAESFYLLLAVIGSVFFLYQLITSLFGVGFDDSGDAGVDSGADGLDGLKFLSIKGVISFVTFFGWAGFFWGGSGWPGFLIAVACGALMMFLTALVLFLLLKMQQSGNIDAKDFIGCSGTVYLTIPANRARGGQVTVSLPSCTRRVAAVADEEIKTGSSVKVVEAINNNLFLVKGE